MYEWHVACGDIFIYGLHKARCFEEHPRYRMYWADYFKWHADMGVDRVIVTEIARLEAEGHRLHTLAETLFPAPHFSWTHHYELHMVAQLAEHGPQRMH